MSYSKLILQDSANIVWPLDDISQSSSISQSINFLSSNPFAYSASINTSSTDVIEVPILFGGGKALNFTSSAVGLSLPALDRFSELYKNKNSCISFWIQVDQLTTTERLIFKKRGTDNVSLLIKDNYLIFRYGKNNDYMEVSGYLNNPEEPNHIVLVKTPESIFIIINGNTFSPIESNNISLDKDNSHNNNNYLDFYGPSIGSWVIDSIAIYSNILNESSAKRHYVYGLGKNFGDDIFYARGGSIYNLSTIDTEKLFRANWRYPQEWYSATINNLNNSVIGIQPVNFSEPDFYTYESNIQTASNRISFRTTSGSVSAGSYIDITSLFRKIGTGENPFFVKVKLDGPLPNNFVKQRIMSIGEKPDNEIIKFNLYNNSGSYQLMVETITSSSVTFNIENIQSKPSIYLGMQFIGDSIFYFSQEGSSLVSASLNYSDVDGYGLDPLTPYFPLSSNKLIRIGSAISYDRNNFSVDLPSVEQFGGSFESLLVHDKEFTSSVSHAYLDNYRNSAYKITFDSNLNRFKAFTYGDVTFNIHAINISEFITDTEQKIGANIISVGYPDIISSSQVLVYVTHLDYSASVIYPKTRIYQNNYLPFINNKNISGTYLKFDIEVYSEDSNYYPPIITNFVMETYKANDNKVVIRSDSANSYTLHQSASSIYLPDIKRTPNIFITKFSGLKLFNSVADFTDTFSGKPLDPTTIPSLKLWLDSRFINGLGKTQPIDDSRVSYWKDLSFNNNDAYQLTASVSPIFRIQSQNLFTNNQANGTESGETNGIVSINSIAQSSSDGVISGRKSIKIIPNESSIDSYINMNHNTASISVSANQSYSVLGTVTVPRVQSASALHNISRGIAVYTFDGNSLSFTASSQANNIPGEYNLKTTFTTSSATKYAEIRFYNGSYKTSDIIYWDNLGLYSYTSSAITSSWSIPGVSLNDMPVIKFNGNERLLSTASSNQPYTLYLVARSFNEGNLIGYTASGLSLYSASGYFYTKSVLPLLTASYNNLFNIYSISVTSGSADIYINNNLVASNTIGQSKLSNIIIGSGKEGSFSGDICAVLLYSEKHNSSVRTLVNEWLEESFNISY